MTTLHDITTLHDNLALLQNRPSFQAICPGSLWARDNRWLLSRVQRLAGSAGGGVARPFVPVGDTNRDKIGAFCPGWWFQPGQKGTRAFCPGWSHQRGQKAPLLSRLVSATGTKCPCPPAGPASRWTRDKRHLLSRAQRLPGQMACNKGLFYSSVYCTPHGGSTCQAKRLDER